MFSFSPSRGCRAFLPFLVIFFFAFTMSSYAAPACQVLRVNGANEWQPISWRSEDQTELKGIFPEITSSVLQDLSVETEYGPDLPWNRLFALLENGAIDVLAGAFATDERTEKFKLSLPVVQDHVGVFVRANLVAKPERLEDLVGLSGRAPFGTDLGPAGNEFAAENLFIDNEPRDNLAEDLKMLADERIDYIFMSRSFGRKAVKAAQLDGVIVDLPWSAASKPVHFMFSKKSPCLDLLVQFDTAIEKGQWSEPLARLLKEYENGGDPVIEKRPQPKVSQ
ncbi:transporter substrate-binding domain-containing protein [Labrenzia sp. PHM005]|nr:transporter substrate-binding domain-containing protein [Labrenzia sp. PHM005]